jgi:hypothetical protein
MITGYSCYQLTLIDQTSDLVPIILDMFQNQSQVFHVRDFSILQLYFYEN